MGKGHLVDTVWDVLRCEHARVLNMRAVLFGSVTGSALREALSERQFDAMFDGTGLVYRKNFCEYGRAFLELRGELLPELQELAGGSALRD